MNKENIDKLLNIIDLLDKITKSSELEKKKNEEQKINSFISSELLQTFESLKKQKSIFPMNFVKDAVATSDNALNYLKSMKSKKTFFYLNKNSIIDDGSIMVNHIDSLKKELSIYSSKQSDDYSKFYELIGKKLSEHTMDSLISEEKDGTEEIAEIKDKEEEEEAEDEKKIEDKEKESEAENEKKIFFSDIDHGYDSDDNSNTNILKSTTKKTIHFEDFEKENINELISEVSKKVKHKKSILKKPISRKSISKEFFSKMSKSEKSDALSSIKMQSDVVTSRKKKFSLNFLRDCQSDSYLLNYNKIDDSKLYYKMWRKQKKKVKKFQMRTIESMISRWTRKSPKVEKKLEGTMDSNEYLDHTIIGHLFEKIIDTLNVNLKQNIQNYSKKITKLNQENENLKKKLETAVENNDEQAQEIRDLNKRIKGMEEQKLELHKTIEKYEQDIENSKKMEGTVQNNIIHINSLEQENKNLKKEFNVVIALSDNQKKEIEYLQEKLMKKNQQLKEENERIRIAHEQIHQKNNLISQLQLFSRIDTQMKDTKSKRSVLIGRMKPKIAERCHSDTILINYERTRMKLFDSNERGYFFSKTNLNLFKKLKSRRKKMKMLKKELLFHKEAIEKMKIKFDNIIHVVARLTMTNEDLYGKLVEYVEDIDNQKKINIDELFEKHSSFLKTSKKPQLDSPSSYSEFIKLGCIVEIEKLKELLDKKTNEIDLLSKKYENIYKKYVKSLKKYPLKNEDFIFIEKIREHIEEENPIIHSFYVQNKDRSVQQKNKNENKLISYIRAMVVQKNANMQKIKNFKEKDIYRDVEFYVSDKFLKNIDSKDIVNIRYIYSFEQARAAKKVNGERCFLKCIPCEE